MHIYTHTHTHTHTLMHTRARTHRSQGMLPMMCGLAQGLPQTKTLMTKGEPHILSWDEYTRSVSWCEVHLLSNCVLPHILWEARGLGVGVETKSKLRFFFTSWHEPTPRLNSHVDNCSFPVACTACSGANVLTFEFFFKCSEHDLLQLICTC